MVHGCLQASNANTDTHLPRQHAMYQYNTPTIELPSFCDKAPSKMDKAWLINCAC